MRSMDFKPSLGAGRALTSEIAFKDHGTVEEISSKREVEKFTIVGFKS
jgi:hypothetical protein